MRFSNQGAVAMATVASLATATPHNDLLGLGNPTKGLGLGLGLDLGKPVHADIDLSADLSGKVLVAGLLADIVADPLAHVNASAEVVVACEDCHVKGAIDASISLEKVVPALSLSLKDIEVLLDLDVYIGAAATIAVNLVTPAKVSLPLPGLNVEALVHLDLVLGVHTELDVSAGVYVSLPEASLETDILSGDILDVDFSGVVVKVLPIKVRIGCTELLADLRLRVDLGVSAAVDVGHVVSLGQLLPGLDLPTVGAGLELAVYANLLEYVGLFCDAPNCPLVKESYGLNVGAAVELGVAVDELLSIHLAPTVATAVLSIPTSTICIPSYTTSSAPYTTSSASSTGSVSTGVSTSSGPATSSASSTGPASSSASSSGPGSSSGVPSSTGGYSSFPTPPASSTGAASSPSGPAPTSSSSTGAASSPSGPAPTGSSSSGAPSSSGAASSTGHYSSYPSPPASGSSTGAASSPSGPAPTGSSSAGASTTVPAGYTTSTVSSTATYTVTACAVNVPNCPAGYQTSATVTHTTSYTTVCPISTGAYSAAPTSTGHGIETITKHVTTMVPCDSTTTFVPPTSISAVPYPSDVPTHVPGYSTGAASPSGSAPAGYPTNSYPVVGHSAGATYPAGGATYPAGGATYPAGGAGPTGGAYPTGGNGTASATWSTHQPTASTPAGYPTSTPPATAGAGKVAGSIAAVVALMGAVMAL